MILTFYTLKVGDYYSDNFYYEDAHFGDGDADYIVYKDEEKAQEEADRRNALVKKNHYQEWLDATERRKKRNEDAIKEFEILLAAGLREEAQRPKFYYPGYNKLPETRFEGHCIVTKTTIKVIE